MKLKVEGVAKNMFIEKMGQKIGLYIHIPFCLKKCNYCDFLSFSNMNSKNMEEYVEYLCEEIKLYPKGNYDTIYFGGGTPSILDPKLIEKILLEIGNTKDVKEITLEINPETVGLEELEYLKKIGVNRLSIGVQSFNPVMLGILGRAHTREKSIQIYNGARQIGFKNISLDLMFATPGQTKEELEDDLKELFNLNPEHFSIYSLIWEAGTPFYKKLMAGELKETDEDIESEMFEMIINKAKENGYVQYEVSNFAKIGYESEHNKKYWKNSECVGVGIGASGYLNGVRYKNSEKIEEYYLKLDLFELPIVEKEIQNEKNIKEYYYMMGLRLLQEGVIPYEESKEKFEVMRKKGFLEKKNKNYILTKKGLFFANDVIIELL